MLTNPIEWYKMQVRKMEGVDFRGRINCTYKFKLFWNGNVFKGEH